MLLPLPKRQPWERSYVPRHSWMHASYIGQRLCCTARRCSTSETTGLKRIRHVAVIIADNERASLSIAGPASCMSFQVAGAYRSSQSAFYIHRRSTQSPLRPRSSCPLQHWTASCHLDLFRSAQSTHTAYATVSSSAPVSTFAEQLLEVGRVLTTHGIKGEIKVEALTDFPEQRLTEPGTRWVTVEIDLQLCVLRICTSKN